MLSFEDHTKTSLPTQLNELLVHYKNFGHDELYLKKARHTKELLNKVLLRLAELEAKEAAGKL